MKMFRWFKILKDFGQIFFLLWQCCCYFFTSLYSVLFHIISFVFCHFFFFFYSLYLFTQSCFHLIFSSSVHFFATVLYFLPFSSFFFFCLFWLYVGLKQICCLAKERKKLIEIRQACCVQHFQRTLILDKYWQRKSFLQKRIAEIGWIDKWLEQIMKGKTSIVVLQLISWTFISMIFETG